MQGVQPTNRQLQDLLSDVESGDIQLPDFQRDFKWKTVQTKALLETIQQGHPAGALLFLTNPEEGSPFGEVPLRYASPPSGKRPDVLVLDGQQRLTSCFIALRNKGEGKPKRDVSYFIDLRALHDAHVNQGPGGEIEFAECVRTRPWDPNPNQFLQTDDLLALSLLRVGAKNKPREALKTAMLAYRDAIRGEEAGTAYFDFIDHGEYEGYLENFFTYAFPVITLPDGLSVAAVCKIFESINTRGLRLGAFDLTVASLRRQDRSLKKLWDNARTGAVRILDKDGTNTLQTLALLANKPSKKAELPKTITAADIDQHWNNAVEALQLAGQFVSEHGGGNPIRRDYLPYDGIVPSLAAILKRVADQKLSDQPAANARSVIARWYFTSALGQRYNEGTDVLQERDKMQILAAALRAQDGAKAAGLEPQGWSPNLWATAAPSGAIGKALKCALNYRGPKDPLTPGVLGPGASPTQLHHIFPRGYLRGKTGDQSINSVLNQTFLSPETNRLIGKLSPSQYIPELIAGIRQKLSTTSKLDPETVLKSTLLEHFIDDAGYSAMLADDFQAFLAARARAFAAFFETAFGVQLKDLSNDASAEESAMARVEDEAIGEEEAENEFGLADDKSEYDAA